ncbi:MAG: polysaccharide pyruvyl transferase family protein, partial [Planococcus sp. (in: Bacteria)]|nr:polysaccharide pyruvyl transferase family protein [Planococcus sp. (in: firmicutes)]
MRIVLSGYYGFDNVGDEAILYAIIHSLKEYYPRIEIIVLSNKPEKTAETYRVKAVNRWSLKDIRAAIKSSDGLISGGGSLLQDETGRKSIP